MADLSDKTGFRLTTNNIISAIAFVVSLAGLYYTLNTRITILEERDRQRSADFTEMKLKVDKIYDIVIKLEK